MKSTTWAALGSLSINLVLGLLIAALFSAAPAARAAERTQCVQHAVSSHQAPARQAAPHRSYIVAVRMGWAG
jgi:hypothetical protein